MNHYEWLRKNFPKFLSKLGLEEEVEYAEGIIVAEADKCYGYEFYWKNNEVPFVMDVPFI